MMRDSIIGEHRTFTELAGQYFIEFLSSVEKFVQQVQNSIMLERERERERLCVCFLNKKRKKR